MPKIHRQKQLAVAATRVWQLIEDFGNIEKWWPNGLVNIERVELEGSGLGMVRHIYNEGSADPVSEKLDFLDAKNFSWQLSMTGTLPAGLTTYKATGTLIALGTQSCQIEYSGQFESETGREDESHEFLLAAYELIFTGLENTAHTA